MLTNYNYHYLITYVYAYSCLRKTHNSAIEIKPIYYIIT